MTPRSRVRASKCQADNFCKVSAPTLNFEFNNEMNIEETGSVEDIFEGFGKDLFDHITTRSILCRSSDEDHEVMDEETEEINIDIEVNKESVEDIFEGLGKDFFEEGRDIEGSTPAASTAQNVRIDEE